MLTYVTECYAAKPVWLIYNLEDKMIVFWPLLIPGSRGRFAGKVLKMEYQDIDTNMILRPVSLFFIGNGEPVGNDPSQNAQRTLSQHLVYLCRREAKTAGELAEETGIPVRYIEEELELHCRGINGQYGLLRNVGQGKYIANIIIADWDEYTAVNSIYREYASAFCNHLADCIAAEQEELRSFLQRSRNKDINLLLWSLMEDIIGAFVGQVEKGLDHSFANLVPSDRQFTTVAVAHAGNLSGQQSLYGCDSISGQNICGYSYILVRNLYGKRLRAHFHCGHDIGSDPLLLFTIRCIGGLAFSDMSESEYEIAVRAIQIGYLHRRGEMVEPAILILPNGIGDYMDFQKLLGSLPGRTQGLAHSVVRELTGFMKECIPGHLLDDYRYYNSGIASQRFFHDVVEECIRRGILDSPVKPLGPEGVLMVLGI